MTSIIEPSPHPTFREALRFWLKLGFISFGGPSGQIAIMHGELVDKRKWVSEDRFLHALNYCMLLPGPEAQQLATYMGWLLHGIRGGLAAGILFVLPAVFLLFALSWIYVALGHIAWIAAFFYGLKPAVIAIVATALLRLGQRTLKTPALWLLAGVAFVGIYFVGVPFPAIVFGAGAIGWLAGKFAPRLFTTDGTLSSMEPATRQVDSPSHCSCGTRTLDRIVLCALAWIAPVIASGFLLGWTHTVTREGLFFSKAALVTFGGAYAVLPYVAQHAVNDFAWLTPPQMVDGLALAETTPGPLIMVLQFVGFLGAWQNPGALSPLLAATLGAAMTTWVTFAPSFLYVFAGGPYIERMRGVGTWNTALTAITAAVVGVILNLAVWFAVHTMVPAPGRIDWFVVGMSGAGIVALRRFKLDVIYLVPIFGIVGIVYSLAP
jgi:chromate transporter